MSLAFVADRAVLGFVIFHGHFEHVIAADADAVDRRGWFGAGFGFGRVRGVLRVLRFAHERILARRARGAFRFESLGKKRARYDTPSGRVHRQRQSKGLPARRAVSLRPWISPEISR